MTYYLPFSGYILILHTSVWVMIAITFMSFGMCLFYDNKDFDGSAFGFVGYYLVKGMRRFLK